MSFVHIEGVCKGYGDDPCAVVRDVHLTIARGERVAIVGRSGSGKTTLLSMLAGLVRPSRGTIRVGGRVAVVFQGYSLLPWLTVHENVRLAVDQVQPGWSSARRRERTDEYVALVGLAHARDRRPAQLSGGMRQRVAVARALAMEPELLLMDEPFGALDALTRASLQDEVERIWSRDGNAALLVTNDVDEAIRLADRIVPLTGAPATLGTPIAVHRHDRRLVRARVIAQLRGEELEREAA